MRIKESIRQKVVCVLEKNWTQGKDYGYTAPALWKYPHQWLWDSCFAAIIWSKINPDRAKKELETLLSAQRGDGFIPHIIKWPSGKTSNLTQPPVVALALEEVYKNTGDINFLEKNLPKVKKYFRWLKKERDLRDDGLLFIVHPWESTDASPTLVRSGNLFFGYWQLFENLFRKKFRATDILFNCIYAQGLRCLARLTGDEQYDRLAGRSERAIFALPYDGTAGSLMPIILEGIPKKKATEIVARLRNKFEFGLPYPIPFVARNNPAFDPNYHGLLWRGPTWININWFIVKGLLKHGHKELAGEIIQKSIDLVDREGCWEFYNPLTGRGQGQKDYTWSTLVLDMEI